MLTSYTVQQLLHYVSYYILEHVINLKVYIDILLILYFNKHISFKVLHT